MQPCSWLAGLAPDEGRPGMMMMMCVSACLRCKLGRDCRGGGGSASTPPHVRACSSGVACRGGSNANDPWFMHDLHMAPLQRTKPMQQGFVRSCHVLHEALPGCACCRLACRFAAKNDVVWYFDPCWALGKEFGM